MSRPDLRQRLFAAQDGKCHYCGHRMNMRVPGPTNQAGATIDHKEPKADGNGYHRNSVGACARCNTLKGATPYAEFVALLRTLTLDPPSTGPRKKPKPTLDFARRSLRTKCWRPEDMGLVGYATNSLGDILGPALALAAKGEAT